MDVDSPSALSCQSYILLLSLSISEIPAVLCDGHSYGITTESSNVLLHPLDSKPLVLNIEILLLSVSEFEDVETIVDGNNNDGFSSFDGIGYYSSSIYKNINHRLYKDSRNREQHLPQILDAPEQ